MLTIGPYQVNVLVSDYIRLDGGAMFGAVPKVLWERKIKADERNRIPMLCRLLLLKSADRFAVVDLGCGNKWNEKERDIYAIESKLSVPIHQALPGITDVILTHLHFDHCGGVSYRDESEALHLSFPDATHHLQEFHWEYSRNPVIRERASFFPANLEPLKNAELNLLKDGDEVLPGVKVYEFGGHTNSMQGVVVSDGKTTLAFPADLIPTAHHIHIPYVMGYDLWAERSCEEKEMFLEKAVSEDWVVVFEHDVDTAAGRIGKDNSGKYHLSSTVEIDEYVVS